MKSHINPDEVHPLFERLTPTAWDDAVDCFPVERAKRFFFPYEQRLDLLDKAKRAIAPYIRGQVSLASARVEFLQYTQDLSLGDHFEVTANFYHALVHGAVQYVQSRDAAIRALYPTVEYHGGGCCGRCTALNKQALQWESKILRTFYPPWRFDCRCMAIDSDRQPSETLPSQCEGDEEYFCNPIDFLVGFSLQRDFSGILPSGRPFSEKIGSALSKRFRKQ